MEGHDYSFWYRLAEEVFGSLIPHLSREEIAELTPKRTNWFAIPLASETDIKDVANRPDPHIDFKLQDDNTVRIGMRCNTVASVEKMENILDSLQSREKHELVEEMKKLDGDFHTQVLAKIKERNFAQVPDYDLMFDIPSNRVDELAIAKIFEKVKAIRDEGKRRMQQEEEEEENHHRNLNPETPVLDICFVTIKRDPDLFKKKLLQMKRMYEICLSIKTATELQSERRKEMLAMRSNNASNQEFVIKYKCSKCGKEYSHDSTTGMKFCDQDGMRIIIVKEPK